MSLKKRLLFLWILILIVNGSTAQRRSGNQESDAPANTPKLMVGIVVDQMRYDYLTRFWNHFGKGGFKRLVEGGFLASNHHFNYAPTSTAPGHASVYTGSVPAHHGIIGNTWFDKDSGTEVYCVSDESYQAVGAVTSAGQMSPKRLQVTTLTDQLRLHTQMRGKVIAVALKDRGSVLPGGHTANAAYWFYGGSEGKWISSSYYMNELPEWVNAFNASGMVDRYKKTWDTEEKIQKYTESGADNSPYERTFETKQQPVFPYDIPALWDANGQYELLKETPFGNSITTDFALAALENESLGTDDFMDFLAISYSSTDYIGHRFGVNSKEVQDVYVRLDKELERLLKVLDKQVGEDGYTLFLTSDHAAMEPSEYLRAQKIPAGFEVSIRNNEEFRDYLNFTYGSADIIRNISNHQVFLDHRLIESLDLELREVQEQLAREILKYEGIDRVYTGYQMQFQNYTSGIPYLLQNGYNQKRSGDILYVPAPGFALYGPTGSTHGSPHVYDTHVPLIMYGRGIRTGQTFKRTEIPDIVPTLAVLTGIAFPNGLSGQPITEALE
jgi:predicted AlkP superfamily pyrophosphatase or phosphodiesterase